ncbi:MAG TPA: GNAT family N-acetyltransferase [Bryobacteraceae bacterium]|nr:GNAT family N-acetyltransferase [Bryobacteraceae bacterium]
MIRGGELGSAEEELWSRIQSFNAQFASPYFSPHYARALAATRDDCFVGVLEDGARPFGFFPFHLKAPGVAGPAIQRLSDYEGVIANPEAEWTAEEVLAGCGLSSWDFLVLLESQLQFRRYHRATLQSPILDLSAGFESYANDIRRRGSRMIEKLQTQRRVMERDLGPIRYQSHVPGSAALGWFMACKSAHYRRTGFPDHFQKAWFRGLVERIHDTQLEDFAGVLSVLQAGDTIVAMHFGVRSRTAWHYWFPCYDTQFGKYSPGLILLLEMARSAPSLGLRHIDLGRGITPYKVRFGNGGIALAEGTVSLSHPSQNQPSTQASQSSAAS